MAIDLGRPEWFKLEKLRLIEQIKAVDSFAAAARSFQKLVETKETDAAVNSALHTAGVVHYGRPFSNNRGGRVPFTNKIIKPHPKYNDEIHRQLIVLRNKFIAHSDQDYVDGRMFEKKLNLEREWGQVTALVGAVVITQTVDGLHDIALAERYLMQAKAAEEAACTDLARRLEALIKAGQQFPSAFEAARAGRRPPIIGTKFQLTPTEPTDFPIETINPHAVLTRPALTIGQDGYTYRALAVTVNLSGTISWREPDGSQFSIAVEIPPKSSA